MILVDTHILIWDALTPQRLSAPAAQALARANQQDGFMICDISLWEIAMLIQKGRVKTARDSQSFITLMLQANKCEVLSITPQIAALSAQLPNTINADPADRLILATAIAEKVPLITADQTLQAAKLVPIIW